MEKIYIQQWDEEKFFNAREEWTDLLSRSDADPLFLSWEWQASWWQIFSEDDMKLRLFTATDDSGKLLGIAPLFLMQVSTRGIRSRRLQFIGNCSRSRNTMPTELLDFIVDTTLTDDILKALLQHIQDQPDWDELLLAYLNKTSATAALITHSDIFDRCYVRHAETHLSYYLKTGGIFEDYIKTLSKSVRLKIFNRRKRLAQKGEITFTNHTSESVDENFERLNHLHEKRWGKPVFKNKRLTFNKKLASLMAEKNALSFSLLKVDKVPVSIQYNYIIQSHVYNIQAGFDDSLDKKIPLGYLHFGYEIENAFKQGLFCYDFLAGEGKNTQYKATLTASYIEAIDYQVIRKPILKLFYILYSFIGQ